MSVPIIENWSNISAEITGMTASQDLSGFMEVEMLVDSVTPANDYPSLLDDTVGTHLIVHFPADLVESSRIEAGSRVSCRVRKAGHSRCFVHREHVEKIDPAGGPGLADYR